MKQEHSESADLRQGACPHLESVTPYPYPENFTGTSLSKGISMIHFFHKDVIGSFYVAKTNRHRQIDKLT